MTWRSTPRSKAATAGTRCQLSRRLGDLGTERRLHRRRSRCGPRARTRASTGPRASSATSSASPTFDARRHRGHDVARGEAGRVDARVDDASAASRSSRRSCGRSATSPGSSTTSARCRRRPTRRRCRSLAERLDEAAASSRTSGSGRTSTSASPTGSTIRAGRTARRPIPCAGTGTATCRAATFDDLWVDACRSLILLDTLGLAGRVQPATRAAPYIAPSIDISAALPPLPARRAVAVRARRRSTSAANGLIGVRGPRCGRTTARCSRSARASCSAGPRRADRT